MKINKKKLKAQLNQSFTELFDAAVISIAVIGIIFWFVGQPFEVTGESMVPNFLDGEQIIAEKISYKLENPNRGDVVIIRHPENKKAFAIKRVVGLPNEEIEVRNGLVYINGEILEETYLSTDARTNGRNYIKEGIINKIPEDSYALFGDNRNESMDSRVWGFINEKDIIGKSVFVYYPIENWRIISPTD